MLDRELSSRCHELIAVCEEQFGWSLDEPTRAQYAEALAPLIVALPAEHWPMVAANYHADHGLVASLRDTAHPDHEAAWSRWCGQVIGVLRRSGRDWSHDTALEVEDLAQVARLALLRALPGYRYRSRFTTWAYSVINRSARDQLRAARAQRRSGATSSLEAFAEHEQLAEANAVHEAVALERILAERVAAVLRSHHDHRLERIFTMWAQEEQTSAAIGAVVGLSEARVRALLKLARERLRADPEIRRWNERER